MPVTTTPPPTVIQGGMGIAVSSWQLAREVSRSGQLGVVSGTALDGVLARVLGDGDPGGHRRRALAHFPAPAMAQRVLDTYFVEGGRKPGQPYRPHPTLTISPSRAAIELSLVGNFAEVWLAKEGHSGVVGINMLEKIQTANASAILGAMLADVDYVIMGAGVPREIPRLITEYAAGRPGHLTIDVAGATKVHRAELDPVAYLGDDLPVLRRPKFLAIVSLHVLAGYLNRDPEIRPDGFVVEGPRAGGHSAPPRGKMVLDDAGEPVYGPKDDADLAKVAEIGLPFWLAGAYATPTRSPSTPHAAPASRSGRCSRWLPSRACVRPACPTGLGELGTNPSSSATTHAPRPPASVQGGRAGADTVQRGELPGTRTDLRPGLPAHPSDDLTAR